MRLQDSEQIGGKKDPTSSPTSQLPRGLNTYLSVCCYDSSVQGETVEISSDDPPTQERDFLSLLQCLINNTFTQGVNTL